MNGWTNYETWNVSLWIQNDEGLYNVAKDYRRQGYRRFAEDLTDWWTKETPDGVSWTDATLNIEELDEMMAEL